MKIVVIITLFLYSLLVLEVLFDFIPTEPKPQPHRSWDYFECLGHHRMNMRELGICFTDEMTYQENLVCSDKIEKMCDKITS